MSGVTLPVALVLVLTLRVSAGIVEDAEEELKKLDIKKPAVTVQVSTSDESPRLPVSADPAPVTGSRAPVAAARPSEAGVTQKQGGLGVVNIEEQAKNDVSTRPGSSKRSSKDRLYSLFGVLFLLALVAIGAALGKEGVREE